MGGHVTTQRTLSGLGGRVLLPADPAKKSYIETLAGRVNSYREYHRAWCDICGESTSRRAHGLSCPFCCGTRRNGLVVAVRAEELRHRWIVRGYMRKGNGEHQARWFCCECGSWGVVAKDDKAAVEDICLRDSLAMFGADKCARCGAEGAEEHHWAPSAIFADAENWPKSPLCPTCHRTWHKAMREAGGHRAPGGVKASAEKLQETA